MSYSAFNEWFLRKQFGGKVLRAAYKKLRLNLKNGVPLQRALTSMYMHASDDGRKPDRPAAVAFKTWNRKLSDGKTLGIAVRGWVPEMDRVLIEAGERAGDIQNALANALKITAGKKKIRGALMQLSYPALLMAVAIALLIFFGTEIIPEFEAVMPREKWQGAAASMAYVADFVKYWLMPVGVAIGAIAGGIIFSLPRWTGPIRVFFDRFPPWSIYRLTNGASFMMSVSALLKSGMQLPDILRLLNKDSTPYFSERMSGILYQVSNGKNLGEAMWLAGHHFPDDETIRDLRSYADLDGFDEILESMGNEWLDESIEKIQLQTGILKQVALLFLGFIFALIVSGLMALQQQMSSLF